MYLDRSSGQDSPGSKQLLAFLQNMCARAETVIKILYNTIYNVTKNTVIASTLRMAVCYDKSRQALIKINTV